MQSKNNKPVIAFVHIPKTAGTTFIYMLRNTFGLGHCDIARFKGSSLTTAHELAVARRVFPGLKSIAGHSIVDPVANLPGTLPYTFLRDPLERCASYYQDNVRRAGEIKPFEEWIQNPQQQNLQTRMIAGTDDLELAKRRLEKDFFFTGLFERYHESLLVFNRLSPYRLNLSYKNQNVFSGNAIKKEVMQDKNKRALLEKYNDKDKRLYDFVANDLYQRQIASAGPGLNHDEINTDPGFGPRAALSFFYNKFIWRQITKFFPNR